MAWHPCERGDSLGTTGSEHGTIERDEEHTDGARITLERDGRTAPWTITCGVYCAGFMTEFYSTREDADADYDAMKRGMDDMFGAIDRGEDVRTAVNGFFDRWT